MTFKKSIHKAICKAVIKEIKKRKPCEYDDQPSYEVIMKYFYDAQKGMKLGFSFCPNDESLINILEEELK